MSTQSIDSQPKLSYIEKAENSVTRAFGGIMLGTQPILAIGLIINLGRRRSGRQSKPHCVGKLNLRARVKSFRARSQTL